MEWHLAHVLESIGPYVTSCWLELSITGSCRLLSISRYMYKCHLALSAHCAWPSLFSGQFLGLLTIFIPQSVDLKEAVK